MEENFSHFKKTHTALWIVIAIVVGIFMLFLFAKHIGKERSATPQEKLNVLENLRSTPPDDGSVQMTEDQKLKILNDLSGKKQPADPKAHPLTEAERDALMKSAE